MVITRLGQGVDATGRLDPAAIERTVEVLRGYKAAMDRHDVSAVRMTATYAARDAANSDAFFDAAAAAVGVRPVLISGAEGGELRKSEERRVGGGGGVSLRLWSSP